MQEAAMTHVQLLAVLTARSAAQLAQVTVNNEIGEESQTSDWRGKSDN
jgi:hypothetical protein